ncbi:zinc finger protein 624-like [Trichosurus vulpecula]|uniref:zinc finger protein 624-like n=1 Tax=Trichosurus vulpecula TaxID=9337 RepID=UPI00186AE2FC|nr:zinc finger protein 624-like [Trichosurus vulpecula]
MSRGLTRRCRLPTGPELVTFKDMVTDFTKEKWDILDHFQKELYKKVVLEKVQNLLSLEAALSKQSSAGTNSPSTLVFPCHLFKRIHSAEKPCENNQCGKTFRHNSSLATYQRIHIGERPYEFNQCGKNFTLSFNPAAHQRIHTGEKPSEFNQCGKTFRKSSSLVTDQRIQWRETF